MDDKSEPNIKRLAIDEILTNLLSCSEEESTLETTVHVYDPKELQSGWQAVTCSAKYIACPDKRSPSVKNDSTNINNCSLKQKRKGNRNKKTDSRQENVSDKFSKYENLGVLSYGVSSWRTIVDPETHTYIKRSHPCINTSRGGDGAKKSERVSFLDPGSALDKHLGDFIKRQRATTELLSQSSFEKNLTSFNSCEQDSVPQRCPIQSRLLQPRTEMHRPLRPLTEFRLKSLASTLNPTTNSLSIHMETASNVPSKELSPLVISNSNIEQKYTKSLRGFPPSHQLRQFHKPCSPLSFQIITHPIKRPKDKKLNWLPITSTTPCIRGNSTKSTAWPPTIGISQNPVNHAISQLKSQRQQKMTRLKPSIPCKMLELPLTLSGSI